MPVQKNNIEELFKIAIQNHQNNNLKNAGKIYQKILSYDPNHMDANNNLGLIFYEFKDFKKSLICYQKVIEINPNNSHTHHNLGLLFYAQKEFEKAIIHYKKAIEINSNYFSAYYNLGLTYQTLKNFNEAINCYKNAINLNPKYKIALNNLGIISFEIGNLKDALTYYEKAIMVDPKFGDAFHNLGMVLRELGEYEKAKECYEKAININPKNINSYNNLGNVHKKLGNYIKANNYFKKALSLQPNSVDAQVNIANIQISQLDNFKKAIKESYKASKFYQKKTSLKNNFISYFRLKHDIQQAEYLITKNIKVDGAKKYIKIGKEILNRAINTNDLESKVFLNKKEIDLLNDYHKAHYIYSTPILKNISINYDKNWKDVENQYFDSDKQIIYIDNFLSQEAIKELRNFCLLSKVWLEERKNNKYLGSFSDKGFISNLHLKIALDLKQKLPKLFGIHRLGRFWGFKYDSFLGKGINIHADFAALNLNFWITPDEYNNNKESGGLKVYDVPAPRDWNFKKYNANSTEIYKFLKKNNAKCTNIHYKFNRAVLFNSDYFHKTDDINFKDSYEARRINITYLFGDRLFKEN